MRGVRLDEAAVSRGLAEKRAVQVYSCVPEFSAFPTQLKAP